MKLSWQWTIAFAVGFRMFTHAILAERAAYNACWMVPLLGFLLALPAVLIAARRWRAAQSTQFPTHGPGYALRGLALLYLLVDTAQLVLLFQEAGQFSALRNYPSIALPLVLLAMALFVIRQNRNGVFSIGPALKSLLWIILGLLILFRIPEMHVDYLFPILGGGWRALLLGGLSCAGIALQFLILLSVAPDLTPKTGAIVGMWAVICAGASAVVAIETMLSPIVPAEQTGLIEALERLLASGRTSVALQLPLYLAWFIVHFIAVCANLKAMAVMGAEITRHEENLWHQLAAVGAVAVAAIVGNRLTDGPMSTLIQWPGALRYAALALAALALWVPEKRDRKAVSA